MAFFTDEMLTSFNDILKREDYLDKTKKKTFLQKNKLALLNKNGVMKWLIETRPIGSTSHPRPGKRTTTTQDDFIQAQLDTFVLGLAQDQCKNQVGEWYGIDSVESSISLSEEYDILLVVTDTHKNAKQTVVTPDDYIKFKMQQVKGFMIVEKGECEKHPKLHAVKLICSIANQGTLLMGMYLYTLLTTQTGVNQTGILELARGYNNTPGLCTYTKFGFSQDDDLNGNDCFSDFAVNLPMSVKLHGTRVTVDHIIEVILGKKKKLIIVDPNDTELCTTYKPEADSDVQKGLQEKLANLIEEKRRNIFLPTASKSNKNYDLDINTTKSQISNEKGKKPVSRSDETEPVSGSDKKEHVSCIGYGCTISGGKQTNRKRKGRKRTNHKRKVCKRTTRKK